MNDAVIIAIIGGVVSLGGALLTAFVSVKLARLHKQINSRMDELLAQTKLAGNAEGRKELKEEQKAKL